MSGVKLSHEFDKLERRFRHVSQKHRDRAALYTIRNVASDHVKQTKTVAKKSLRVAKKHFRNRVRITRRPNIVTLEARVGVTSRRLPLGLFRSWQTRKGISVKIGNRLVKYGRGKAKPFIEDRKVFVRKSRSRLPLKFMYGPGLGDVWERPQDWRKLAAYLRRRTSYHYLRRMKALMRGF